MKKIILSLFLLLAFSGVYAQKSNVRKAKAALNLEVPDFKTAREAIKLALLDSTTNTNAETWYLAGSVGFKESESPLIVDVMIKGNGILESYKYFLTAVKYDSLPDAKGKVKPKYSKDIKAKLKSYYTTPIIISYGANLYDKKDYLGAVNAFEVYLGLPKLPLMNNELKMDSTYTKIKYYTALACFNGSKNDKGLSYLNELKSENFEAPTVYRLICDEYLNRKDTLNYERTLKEGFEKLPNDSWFLQNLINTYIFSGRSKEALVYLNTAIERDPKSAQYWYVKGNVDENMNNFDSSMASFNKAIELDPNFAEAYSAKGRLIFNKAVKQADAANDIKDIKAYKAEMKKVDAVFKESLPFFIKASELNPKKREYKETLKQLYYRLKMDAEYEAISKEINAI